MGATTATPACFAAAPSASLLGPGTVSASAKFLWSSLWQKYGVRYISGDTWNVNPVALKRVARLFCKNERVVVPLRLDGSSESVTLVPVGAILVASIQLNFLDEPLNLKYRGPNCIDCQATFRRGEEMGYFRHGSTILVFTSPGIRCLPDLREGGIIRMGSPLLRHS